MDIEKDSLKKFAFKDPLGQWHSSPKEWKEKTLWELATYINGRAFKQKDFSNFGFPIIKVTELKYGLSYNTAYYNGDYENKLNKYIIDYGDLLFAWSGNPETSIDAFLWRGDRAILNQHIFKVIPNKNINKIYLFFLLKYLRPTFVRTARDKATSMGHVRTRDLKRLIAKVPSLKEQDSVAQILEPLDNEIHLNDQMNKTLGEIAQAIFKSWFVDFEPFLDGEFEYSEELDKEIPKGWEVKRLDEIAEVNQGKTPKAMDYADNGHKMLKHGDISDDGWIDWYRKEKGFVKHEIEESKLRRILPGDVLISNSAHAEHLVAVKRTVVHFIPEDYDTVYFTGELTSIRPINYINTTYIHQFFISDDGENQIRYHQRGMHLTVGESRKISILAPHENSMAEFDKVVRPLYQQISNNIGEIMKLTDLRDAFLPKLMSGEIRITTHNI